MELLKDRNKRNGLITTAVVHILLLVIFILTGLTIPVPLPEQGILINFGTSDEGLGEVQPDETTSSEATENPEETVVESQAEPTENTESVITQNTEEAPALNKTQPSNIENIEVEEEKEPEPVVNPAALYPGKKSNTNTGSEGETKEGGDQGAPDGSTGSKIYGDRSGSGMGFSLAGRKVIYKQAPQDNFQETGRVVVNIWVNRHGKITRATPGAKGSTTTNAHNYKIAKEAAMKWKFSPDPDALEEQKGTIVFTFTERK